MSTPATRDADEWLAVADRVAATRRVVVVERPGSAYVAERIQAALEG